MTCLTCRSLGATPEKIAQDLTEAIKLMHNAEAQEREMKVLAQVGDSATLGNDVAEPSTRN